MKPSLYPAVVEFETKYHSALAEWVVGKTPFGQDSVYRSVTQFLDISDDYGSFAHLVFQKCNCDRVMSLLRTGQSVEEFKDKTPKIIHYLPANLNNLQDMAELGKFDAIILKDMMHEVADMPAFLAVMAGLLKDAGTGRIFVLARPRNPPLPLPSEAARLWAKTVLARDHILKATEAAGLGREGFSASCPIRLKPEAWGRLLLARTLPAVAAAGQRCSDEAVENFVRQKDGKDFVFEEKLLLFCLWKEL